MLKQSRNKQIPLALILLIALAAYAGVAYWKDMWPFSEEEMVKESPTPTPESEIKSSWEKYENQEDGYSFEYPSSYSIKRIGNNVTLRASGNSGLADLSVSVTQDSRSLDAIVQDKTEGFLFRDHQVIIISGKDAYEGIGQGIINSYQILVKSGGNLYKLSFESGNEDTLEKNKANLDQIQKDILNTFNLIQ